MNKIDCIKCMGEVLNNIKRTYKINNVIKIHVMQRYLAVIKITIRDN